MTMLYILMAVLTGGVCIKLVHKLAVPAAEGKPLRATREDRFLVAVIVLLLPLLALTIYQLTGRPDLRARQAIFDMSVDLQMRQAALLAKRPMSILVEQNPDDIGAHLNLAEINRRIGRYEDEVKFLQRAVSLGAAAQDPLLRHYAATLGQAQVRLNKGIVGDDALETFAFVRGIYADDPLSRHYQALAMAQRGDPGAALDLWRVLLSEGPSRSYWKDMVRKAMQDARADMRAAKTAAPADGAAAAP